MGDWGDWNDVTSSLLVEGPTQRQPLISYAKYIMRSLNTCICMRVRRNIYMRV